MIAAARSRVTPLVAVAVAALCFAPDLAEAQSRELRYELKLDIPVTLAAGAVVGAPQAWLLPDACRWCVAPGELNALDASARQALRWQSPQTAASLSDITAFLATPALSFGLLAGGAAAEGSLSQTPVDLLLSAEATVATIAVTQIVKVVAARQRPFTIGVPSEAICPEDDPYTSFFSGHTSISFAVAVSSGTIASMRGYRTAPWIWATALPLAATAGYLRIAADKHYLTDVLVGAAVGSALGFAIPYVFHRPLDGR